MGGGGELEDGENFRPMAVDHFRQEAHNRSNRSFAEEVERENSVQEFTASKRRGDSRAGSRGGRPDSRGGGYRVLRESQGGGHYHATRLDKEGRGSLSSIEKASQRESTILEENMLNHSRQSRHRRGENPNQSIHDLANAFDQIDPMNPQNNARLLHNQRHEQHRMRQQPEDTRQRKTGYVHPGARHYHEARQEAWPEPQHRQDHGGQRDVDAKLDQIM